MEGSVRSVNRAATAQKTADDKWESRRDVASYVASQLRRQRQVNRWGGAATNSPRPVVDDGGRAHARAYARSGHRAREGEARIWRRRNAKGKPVDEITLRDSDAGSRASPSDVKSRTGKGERVAPNPKLTFTAAPEE